ncbi:MAG TPA: ABC transporter ATP-binding protein [Chloroflexota bacterium]|nr:ABC transporter ATP-binding protein [Chloroflexota bacterium]
MLGFLNRYLRPRWPHVLLLTALVLGNEALQLIAPQIVRTFIDTARAGGALDALAAAGALYLGVALTNQLVGVAESTAAANLGWRATNDLRADLAAHCLGLDMPFHTSHTPGELIERVDGDVGVLRNYFSRFVVHMLGGAFFLAGVLVMLWREEWRVGLFATVMAAIGLTLLVWGRRRLIPYSVAVRQAAADVFGFVEERLGALPDVRANALQRHTVSRMEAELARWLGRVRRQLVRGAALAISSRVVWTVMMAGTLVAVARLFGSGAISLGTAYLLVHYAQEVQSTVGQISRQLEDFQRASAALTRVRDLEAITPTVRSPEPALARTLPHGPLAVALDRVSFSYGGEPVVRDVAVTVPPGRVLGVLGRTGSGKTTLARLVCRLYDVESGAVRLGGVDVRLVPPDDLHRRVALVTQEVQLFRATVRDNVSLFDRTVSDARVLDALQQVGLAEWLAALPAALDTLLEGQSGLSAGQAQLLAFARAFLRDPGVVILDEASSRLDPATEALLERAVDQLLHGRTAIVIAHRLTTLDRADDVLLLEDGQVVEHGPRAALAADPGSRFAQLLRAGGLLSRAPSDTLAAEARKVEVLA